MAVFGDIITDIYVLNLVPDDLNLGWVASDVLESPDDVVWDWHRGGEVASLLKKLMS